MKVNAFYMLDSTDRSSHNPTVVECTEKNQGRIIHMTGYSLSICSCCFTDNKRQCFLTLGLINRCEVKLNLFAVVCEQFDFPNYIDISLECILKSNLHACPLQSSPLEIISVGHRKEPIKWRIILETGRRSLKIPCVFVFIKSVPLTGPPWSKP